MFVCRGCLRNLTRISTTPVGLRHLSPLPRTTSIAFGRRTYFATDTKKGWKSEVGDRTRNKPEPKDDDGPEQWSSSRPDAYKPKKRSQGRALAEKELESGETKGDMEYEGVKKGDELGKQKYQKRLETIVRKQLELAHDPYHIAQHVRKALDRGSFDEALLLTRTASRKGKVEVSWNHLIDYQMKNARLNGAVKLFNEMKKRAQIPNARTYTIIFRGCADSLHPKLAVAQATKIYNFMNKYGALKANTIHMNAVLEVCARAGDMDNLFLILSTANDGIRNPDAATFSIILNALRHDMKKAPGELGLVDAEAREEIKKSIDRARAIWADVIARWKNAKMIVDEHVVCAMGRILATGDYKDNESILDLLHQTMKIPRLDKAGIKLSKLTDDSGVDAPATAETPAPSKSDQPAPDQVDVNKTLSLVLTALANMRKTSSARKYWVYITKHLNVRPDPENHYCYLRTLVLGHASSQHAPSILAGITFRRGMTACINDHRNETSFAHATRIFKRMVTTQRYPDALTMRLFLQVARSNTLHFHALSTTNPTAAKRAHGQQLLSALDLMWEPYRILTGSFSYPDEATAASTISPSELLDKQRGDMQEVMSTARRMIAALDKLIQDGMISDNDKEAIRTIRTRRAILQRLVERYIAKLYPDGPPPEYQRRGGSVFDEEEGFMRKERKALPEDDSLVVGKQALDEVEAFLRRPAAHGGMYGVGSRGGRW
ncbi:hypothetical protein N0V88_005771 [Collariella sp. IMI 366227]|nr:hypothetical protein N0V88_005771 [Collariella sp. IMI 366227]